MKDNCKIKIKSRYLIRIRYLKNKTSDNTCNEKCLEKNMRKKYLDKYKELK